MIAPQNTLQISSLLLVINRFLLSSNEHYLLLMFDSISSDLATEICQQNIYQVKIVYKLDSNLYNIKEKINIDRSIIISTVSHQFVNLVRDAFIWAYMYQILDRKSKHLCILNSADDNLNRLTDMEKFSEHFFLANIHLIPMLWTNNNKFLLYTFYLPGAPGNFSLIKMTPTDLLQENGVNVNDLIFPYRLKHINVVYRVFYFNPPYLNRVQDILLNSSALSSTYIGGIDVRMMELLSDKFDWNVLFVLVNTLEERRLVWIESEMYHKFIGQTFRTIIPVNRRHNIHEVENRFFRVRHTDKQILIDLIYSFSTNIHAIIVGVTLSWNTISLGSINIFGAVKLVIIAPVEWELTSVFFHPIVKSILLWHLVVIIFALLRKITQSVIATKPSPFFDLYFETNGIIAGTGSITTTKTNSERIIVVIILKVSLLAAILCTGIFFQHFSVTQNAPQINNLTDLIANRGRGGQPHLGISAEYLAIFKDTFDKTLFTIHIMLEQDIMHNIYAGNQSYIYVLPQQRAVDLMRNNDAANKANLFYIIPNTYLCMIFIPIYHHFLKSLITSF